MNKVRKYPSDTELLEKMFPKNGTDALEDLLLVFKNVFEAYLEERDKLTFKQQQKLKNFIKEYVKRI